MLAAPLNGPSALCSPVGRGRHPWLCLGVGHLLVLAISASLGLLSAFAEYGEKRGDKGMRVRGCGPETLATAAPGRAVPHVSQEPSGPTDPPPKACHLASLVHWA